MILKRGPRRPRRGQSEVIGGLIVLTLLFLFAIPVVLNLYYATVQTGQKAEEGLAETLSNMNEKLAIAPLDPNSELARRTGWIGVWINNTGTTAVTLDKLYLIDVTNNSIFIVYDMRYARPGNTTYLRDLIFDLETGGGQSPPPKGEPIVLQPGQTLLVVFTDDILPYAPNLVALVESATGILHPIAMGGMPEPIYPGRPTAAGAQAAWRGIFAPQSGFSLRGFDELAKNGIAYAWRPPLWVYPDRDTDWSYEPEDLNYYHTFIYEDPDYPGLYMLDIRVRETTYVMAYQLNQNGAIVNRWVCPAYRGYTIIVKGFVGTYDAGDGGYGTYFNGYAYEVQVYTSGGYLICQASLDDTVYLGNDTIIRSDFDGNGIDELTVYSYLNGPNYDDRVNVDADNDGSTYRDALAWTYMIARDISGIDYVKITVKINYYWTRVVAGSEPSWAVRRLKVFAIVVWKYNPDTGEWDVYQYKNFGYTSEKPVQFQQTAIFPVEKNGTYRVGVIFYDNYRDFDYAFDTWTDFTLSLEHIIVEYGVYNPLFVESPPLYIVAIPDPALIAGIGEEDYAARNGTSITEAKILAQSELLAKIREELNYAGVAGYTVITQPEDLCNLLFSDQPPKYAVIYWLQGNVSITEVAQEAGCTLTDQDVKNYMAAYHWVLVWPVDLPFGDRNAIDTYNMWLSVLPAGNYTLNLTKPGLEVRKQYYAFNLYNSALFKYAVKFDADNVIDTYLIYNATFYANQTANYTANTLFGTIAFWLDTGQGTGAVVLNPVHIDWDATGDGVPAATVAQQIVYSSLIAWVELVSG